MFGTVEAKLQKFWTAKREDDILERRRRRKAIFEKKRKWDLVKKIQKMKELRQAELEIMTADILETWWSGLVLETASKCRKRKEDHTWSLEN